MAKNIKLNIKNTQIAQAVSLGGLKGKLAKKKESQNQPAEASLKPEDKVKNEKRLVLKRAPNLLLLSPIVKIIIS